MSEPKTSRRPWQVWLLTSSLGVFAVVLWFCTVPTAVGFLATVLTALGAVRLLLTPERAGLLVVRSRVGDVATLWGGALALVILTLVMPN